MQFQVPQFIEVEDKIFGPLTFRQFIWIGGGGGLSYVLWRILPHLVAVPFIMIVVAFAAALAFFEYNGRPFILALEHGFYFVLRPRLYLWNNEHKPTEKKSVVTAQTLEQPDLYIPRLSESRLHDLAWSLDIQERIAAGSADESDRVAYDAMKPIRTARDALVR